MTTPGPSAPPGIYRRPQRHRRSGLEWLVRVLVAVILIGGGILAGKWIAGSSSSPSARAGGTALSTAPPASNGQDAATVSTGCGATSLMNDRISEAQQLNEPGLLDNVATGNGTPWSKVTGMETVGSDATYRPLANDVRGFVQAFTLAKADGDVDSVENAMTAVIASCQTLGQNTDASS